MEVRPSALAGALRRVGKKLEFVEDVDGALRVTERKGHRVYGVFSTHDASIAVGFDSTKVVLPSNDCAMRITGKLWLDEVTGRCSIFVTRYAVIEQGAEGHA
jgi:hypothetical protein